MLSETTLIERAPQRYAALELELQQSEISRRAPPLADEVIGRLKAHGVAPAGAPFFDYIDFHPDGRMRMLVGVPTEADVPAEAGLLTGTLPGGRYASVTHTGPYHELMEVNMAVHGWVRRQGLHFAGEETEQGFRGATRLEIYHKDPGEDPSGHPVTEVAFALAD